jgi:ATP-dependent Lhr-like helicase
MVGRWSCFPGLVTPLTGAARLEQWCHQLLRRYGVIFRDLLARETVAPSWYEMIRTLRRLELRGEVRGGRFVAGVSGEQYATEEAVTKLRKLRDGQPDGSWTVVSAADPLNLRGIITAEDRVPATHKNALLLRDGRYVAVFVAGQIEFVDDVDLATRHEMARSLRQGRKVTAASGAGAARRWVPPGA